MSAPDYKFEASGDHQIGVSIRNNRGWISVVVKEGEATKTVLIETDAVALGQLAKDIQRQQSH